MPCSGEVRSSMRPVPAQETHRAGGLRSETEGLTGAPEKTPQPPRLCTSPVSNQAGSAESGFLGIHYREPLLKQASPPAVSPRLSALKRPRSLHT